MKTNLSANREISNYKQDDAFNFIVKAEAIRYFLEYNVESLLDNKMLALYGNWGSGKTSMMRHIEKEINKDIYFPIFFEAWGHEQDDNLALSLCDALTNSVQNGNTEIIQSFRKTAIAVLKGFTSGINIKLSDPTNSFEVTFDGKNTVEALESAMEEKLKKSFFIENLEFKEKFKKVEELILMNSGATRIIVFVDDLDRCEPDNVLNLITAMKLFFTYGEKTIFMAGLDKEAITKAVVTKYKDVVKSEEYLEKVFDISFSIPKSFSLQKYLGQYFEDETELLEDFFQSIGVTNPRHLKKVLNKYEILNAFKTSTSLPENIKLLIPNIIFKQEYQSGNIWETIFCLYFIILYETHIDKFEELEQYEAKFTQLITPYIQTRRDNNKAGSSHTNAIIQLNKLIINDVKNTPLRELTKIRANSYGEHFSFVQFLLIFSHSHPNGFIDMTDTSLDQYKDFYNDKGILTSFCKFLIRHKEKIEHSQFSDYIFWNYFNMAKYLL